MSTLTVFIPGFYGSFLEADGERRWLTAGAVALNRYSFALPFHGEDHYRVAGIMDRVVVVPKFYEVEVYGRLVKALAQHSRVESLAYDWRKSPLDVLPRLHGIVTAAKRRGEKVRFIAHSMGAVAAAYYLRYGTQDPEHASETWEGAGLVESAVFVAAPYLGAMAALRDLNYGVRVAWNKKLLDYKTYGTFQSIFYLLPYGPEDNLVDDSGTQLPGLIRDPEVWRRHRWGRFRDEDPEAQAHARKWLVKSTAFFDALHAPLGRAPNLRCRVMNVAASNKLTMANARIHGDRPDFSDRSLYSPGDGTVTFLSATLPPAFTAALGAVSESGTADHLEILIRSQSVQRWNDYFGGK